MYYCTWMLLTMISYFLVRDFCRWTTYQPLFAQLSTGFALVYVDRFRQLWSNHGFSMSWIVTFNPPDVYISYSKSLSLINNNQNLYYNSWYINVIQTVIQYFHIQFCIEQDEWNRQHFTRHIVTSSSSILRVFIMERFRYSRLTFNKQIITKFLFHIAYK